MNNPEFRHERSPLYQEAREMYRLMLELARSNTGWTDRRLRESARRLLDHATAAGDAPSSAMKAQALRYAKLYTLKISAAVEVGWLEGQLSAQAYNMARRQLDRLFDELGHALPEVAVPTTVPSERSSARLAATPPSPDRLREDQPDRGPDDREEPLSLLASAAPAGTS